MMEEKKAENKQEKVEGENKDAANQPEKVLGDAAAKK